MVERGDQPLSRLAEMEAALAESERRCRALAESERRYRALFELASDFFWETDADNRLTYVSANTELITGIPVASLRGRRLADTPGVTIEPEAGRSSLALIKARRPYRDFVYSRRCPDGRVLWFSSSGEPVFDAGGTFLGYRGIARDITAQVGADLALRQSEQRYRQLVELASEWFWETDPTGRFTFLSVNVEAVFGQPVSAYIGKRLGEIGGVAIDPERGAVCLAAFKGRRPYRDFRYVRTLPNGDIRHISSSGTPFFGEDGEFLGYRGIARDVTAAIEGENKLRDNERHFRELFEVYSDYYWEQDGQHRVTHFWPESKVEELLGIPAAQFYGKRFSEFLHITPEPESGKKVLTAFKARQPYREFHFSVRHPSGKTRWFSSSGAPRWGGDGQFLGFCGIGVEITARIESEAAARVAERQIHDAVSLVGQAFAVFNGEDRIAAYNRAFSDLYRTATVNSPVTHGVAFRELAECQLAIGFYAEGADGRAVNLETLLEHYGSGREHAFPLRDGRWMMAVYRRLPGGGRVGLWTDITAVKRAEAERRTLEVQLHHSQRLEALGTLAGGAAHEINNALVPVIALSKLVASRLPEDGRDRRNLGTILAGAERSRDLVKQILAFSRKEDEAIRQQSVDVGEILRDALRLMRATVPTSIALAEEIAPVPPVRADANQLRQVIVNLVANAAQAIGEGHGTITVGLSNRSDGVCLSVADTGCGMDEAIKARIFEPFFTTKEVGKGTGLGLAVVHGIIKGHGGSIAVESAPGRGSRFEIVLPADAAAAGAAA